jgi:hypothetical protein
MPQTEENVAVNIGGEEGNEYNQLDGSQPSLSGIDVEVTGQSTSSNADKTSQDPLMKILELLQASQQEAVGLKANFQAQDAKLTEQFTNNVKQLTSATREVKQDFMSAMQELSDKFEDKL